MPQYSQSPYQQKPQEYGAGGPQPAQSMQQPNVGGTNAPQPGNPVPTNPYVQQPQAARNPQWQGPPTQSGLPEGRQMQPQPQQNPWQTDRQPQWQPPQQPMGPSQSMWNGQPGNTSTGGYDNGAPLLPGGPNSASGPQGPQVTQGSPQYQGFEGGFQPQGEWGNAMNTPFGQGELGQDNFRNQGPNTMTLPGVPGYTGNVDAPGAVPGAAPDGAPAPNPYTNPLDPSGGYYAGGPTGKTSAIAGPASAMFSGVPGWQPGGGGGGAY